MRLLAIVIALLLSACSPIRRADLCISNATVFLSDGTTLAHQDVLINADTISAIVPHSSRVQAPRLIDAREGLLVPGFVAIDEHLDDVFGDETSRLSMESDSMVVYRKRFAATYLPYGVTTVRTSGDAEEWLPMALDWMRHRESGSPDFYPSGGQLITPYDYDARKYVNHVFIKDSLQAVQKIAEYAEKGIRHIKLYGNLEYPAFTAALHEANRRNLIVSSQVQWKTDFDSTMALGLRNFEQVATLFYSASVLDFSGDPAFNKEFDRVWTDSTGKSPVEGSRLYPWLEAARFVGKDNPKVIRILQKMKSTGSGMVPCLHFFAQWLGKTWFTSTPKAPRFDVRNWTSEQRQRCLEGYEVMAHTTFRMWEMGIPLRIGTDHKDGGAAVLSEMLLLEAAGIPMNEVLLIASRNGADALGLGDVIGEVAVGKRANLVIFRGNPSSNSAVLVGEKVVIKDGVIVEAA